MSSENVLKPTAESAIKEALSLPMKQRSYLQIMLINDTTLNLLTGHFHTVFGSIEPGAPVEEPPNAPKPPPIKEPEKLPPEPPPPGHPPVEEPPGQPRMPPVKEPPPEDPDQQPPHPPERKVNSRLVFCTHPKLSMSLPQVRL
jgi:hypothetical protein